MLKKRLFIKYRLKKLKLWYRNSLLLLYVIIIKLYIMFRIKNANAGTLLSVM